MERCPRSDVIHCLDIRLRFIEIVFDKRKSSETTVGLLEFSPDRYSRCDRALELVFVLWDNGTRARGGRSRTRGTRTEGLPLRFGRILRQVFLLRLRYGHRFFLLSSPHFQAVNNGAVQIEKNFEFRGRHASPLV